MSKTKKYLVLDCETATLPFANEIAKNAKQKQKIAIAKPLIYDIGWKIVDRSGNVYAEKSYLISEIFSVPAVFNTGYYADKRPLYLEKLSKGLITLTDWKTATSDLINDLEDCYAVGAFNSMFDFKKAIPFTERYINALYSKYYYAWEQRQYDNCVNIVSAPYVKDDNKDFEKDIFVFRDKEYNLFDIWGLACKSLINTKKYKLNCLKNNLVSASGEFFKTSAEVTFRYLTQDYDFIESHTAFEDADIESDILIKLLSKGKIEMGIIYFPFRELGTTTSFIQNNKVPKDCINNLIEFLKDRMENEDLTIRQENKIETQLNFLNSFLLV